MDSCRLNKKICRICLTESVELDWNDEIVEFCGVTYKDCYYKYTKLEETDFYPTNLCKICAIDLKTAHLVFEKAVKSFNILQTLLKDTQLKGMGRSNCRNAMKCDIRLIDDDNSSVDDYSLIEIEDKVLLSPFDGQEMIPKIEKLDYEINGPMKDVSLGARHFIDIELFEPSVNQPLERPLDDISVTELAKPIQTKPFYNKDRKSTNPEEGIVKPEYAIISPKEDVILRTGHFIDIEVLDPSVDQPLEHILGRKSTNNSEEGTIKPECAINSPKDDVTLRTGHFIDIEVFEPSADQPLEQPLGDISDTELLTPVHTKPYSNKRKKSTNTAERIPKIECAINSPKEDVTLETRHFIDIEIESAADQPLEQPLNDISDAELPKQIHCKTFRNKRKKSTTNSKEICKRKKCLSPKISLEQRQNEGCGTQLPNLRLNKTSSKIKNSKSLNGTKIEQNHNEICATKSTTKPTRRPREKYLFMCAYCSLKVDGPSRLKAHEATHNENRIRTEDCPQCGIKLFTKITLKQHMKIHDENRQKKHKCEFCEKAFFNKGALNVHRRIHLGLMVKCQICLKEFFRQVDLDRHLPKHSAVSPLQKNFTNGKKKYVAPCQYCNKPVSTVNWKNHIAAHLGQPQVKCKICDKKFFSRTNCTNHLRRLHHKNFSEYEEFIHYYYDRNERVSNLIMKQQLNAQPLTDNL